MVLGFGDPTKGMTRIWGHFVILVGCGLVIFKPQIMLKVLSNFFILFDSDFFPALILRTSTIYNQLRKLNILLDCCMHSYDLLFCFHVVVGP